VIRQKRIKGLYPQIYDFENLYQAYRQARKCKRFRDEVLQFTDNLEENLIELQNHLIWRTYRVGRYREFFVYEPKKRLIMALPFRDRVVQWAIYRQLNPLLERRYIHNSYACRVGRGTHRAADRLQYWMRYLERRCERVYALKLDVARYFFRVDHDILMRILKRIIADEDLLWLLETIIRSEDTRFGVALEDHQFAGGRIASIGMPIGNLTSQMCANLYLNELDQHVKHDLRVRHYLRYMDDMIILHPDKTRLWQLKTGISTFLQNHLRLELNSKTSVRPISQGVDFCGYRIWTTHRKLRKSTAKKMKRRLRYLRRACERGEVTAADLNASWQSYCGLLKHCSSYRLKSKLEQEIHGATRIDSILWPRPCRGLCEVIICQNQRPGSASSGRWGQTTSPGRRMPKIWIS